MRFRRFHLPLTTLAICIAMSPAADGFTQTVQGSGERVGRRQNVLGSGRLTGTRELQQIVSWQSRGIAHLAIETRGPRPRVLWRTDGGDEASRVDSVRVSDLDGDGLPEVISLWWKRPLAGAELRVVHWDRRQNSFVEIQSEIEVNRVHSYRVVRAARPRSSSRIVIDRRTEAGRSKEPIEYELLGSRLVRVGGDRIVTTQGESGIEGQAIISPARPGPTRQGMPNSAPYKTTLVVWRADGDQEVARIETGSDGRFRVALPPGTYRVGAPSQTGRFLPRGSEETVTVVRGAYASVTINFDSGMR